MRLGIICFAIALLAIGSFAAAAPEPEEKPGGMCGHDCAASVDGLALIRSFEGYIPFVYEDAAGLPTIGYGHLILDGEQFNEPLLPEAAEQLLRQDVMRIEIGMQRVVTEPLWQWQYDALTSFTFNVGNGALARSTLLRRVNDGRHADVPPQFMRWVYAGGKRLRGLEIRRTAEAAMYAQ